MKFFRGLYDRMKASFNTQSGGASEVAARKQVMPILWVVLFVLLISFGPVLALHRTVLSSNYVASQVDDINISGMVGDWLDENIAPEKPYLAKAIEIGVINTEPWIKEQLKPAVRYMHGFILKRIEKAELLETIALQRPLIEDVARNIGSVLQQPVLKPVFDSLGVTPASIQKYVNVSQVNSYLDIVEELARVRGIILFAKYSYVPLIILMLILIILLLFVSREVRGFCRGLGIVFTLYGVIQFFTASFPLKNWWISLILQQDMPQMLYDILQRIINDYTAVLQVFSISVLVVGIVLIVASIMYRPRLSAGPNAAAGS